MRGNPRFEAIVESLAPRASLCSPGPRFNDFTLSPYFRVTSAHIPDSTAVNEQKRSFYEHKILLAIWSM